MDWGLILEEPVAQFYAKQQGYKLYQPAPIVKEKDGFPFGAHMDRLVYHHPIVAEVKTRNRFADGWGEPGTDEVPAPYLIQGQHYLLISGREQVDYPVLIGKEDYALYHAPADQELQEIIYEEGRKFWMDHIIPQVPPEIDHSAACLDYIKARYPFNKDDLREATEQEAKWIKRLQIMKEAEKTNKEVIATLEARIKDAIGDHDGLTLPSGYDYEGKVTWKKTKDGTKTDWKGLALSLNPTPEDREKFTTAKPGSRRFYRSLKPIA